MLKPNIPLSYEQLDFLSEVHRRTFNSLFDDPERWMKAIADNNGARDIYRNENGKPTLYLRRFYIYRGLDKEAMIHQFFLGDKGPLHDHPAASWGCILRVGYMERLCTHIENGRTEGEYQVNRTPGQWSARPASNEEHDNFDAFHKVKLRDPMDAGSVITFFVMEKRNKNSWGFRDNDGSFVPFERMNKNEKVDTVQSLPDNYEYGWFPRRITN
jgi:hypothetical protein